MFSMLSALFSVVSDPKLKNEAISLVGCCHQLIAAVI
jgi:hypothetical protein